MNTKEHGRRRFLKESAALAGLAVAGARFARAQDGPAGTIPNVNAPDFNPPGMFGPEAPPYGAPSSFESAHRLHG